MYKKELEVFLKSLFSMLYSSNCFVLFSLKNWCETPILFFLVSVKTVLGGDAFFYFFPGFVFPDTSSCGQWAPSSAICWWYCLRKSLTSLWWPCFDSSQVWTWELDVSLASVWRILTDVIPLQMLLGPSQAQHGGTVEGPEHGCGGFHQNPAKSQEPKLVPTCHDSAMSWSSSCCQHVPLIVRWEEDRHPWEGSWVNHGLLQNLCCWQAGSPLIFIVFLILVMELFAYVWMMLTFFLF